MKTIKLLATMAFIVASISLAAQNSNTKKEFSAEDHAKSQTKTLKEKLNLTSDQEKKVQAIYQKYAEQQEKEMKNRQSSNTGQSKNSTNKNRNSEKSSTKGQRGQGMQGGQQNMTKMNEEIKAVLNSDQSKTFETLQKERSDMKKGNDSKKDTSNKSKATKTSK